MRKKGSVKQKANIYIGEKATAYQNAVYDEARRKGFALQNVEVFLDEKYAIATDNSGYKYRVRLLPKSVAKFGAWITVKNPRSSKYAECKKLLAEKEDQEEIPVTYYGRSSNGKRPPSQGRLLSQLRGKIKLYGYTTAGMHSWRIPAEQLTANEMEIVEDHPAYFEVEDGYVFLSKPMRRNSENGIRSYIRGRGILRKKKKIAKEIGGKVYKVFATDKQSGVTRGAGNYPALSSTDAIKQAKRYFGDTARLLKNWIAKVQNSKSNSHYNEDKIDNFSAMFQGKINGKEIETVGSDLTPPITARLGKLALMKIKNGGEIYEIKFKGDAFLAADARSNLFILGRNGRITNIQLPNKGSLIEAGQLKQINYVTDKAHIENGKMVEYYHEFGEVDGVLPNVHIDHNGFPIISGGNYVIGVHGIEN